VPLKSQKGEVREATGNRVNQGTGSVNSVLPKLATAVASELPAGLRPSLKFILVNPGLPGGAHGSQSIVAFGFALHVLNTANPRHWTTSGS